MTTPPRSLTIPGLETVYDALASAIRGAGQGIGASDFSVLGRST